MTAPCWALQCDRVDTIRYLNGDACPDHTPARLAGHPEPSTQIDPTRTEPALRIMPTPLWAKGGTDIAKDRPGGYMSKQRARKIADQRDAIRNTKPTTREETA